MTQRTCIDCSIDIGARHGNATRCQPCAEARQRELWAADRTQPCKINDAECAAGRLKTGLCETHYRRKRKTGSTELTTADHLARYVADANGCWLWTGPMFRNGYGHISAATFGTTLAHRAFYAHHVGTVPDGMDLDHLCRVRHCVNPKHLEPVTRSVNIQRGVDARLEGLCGRGHDQSEPNARWTDHLGRTQCRKCKAIREREGRERRKAG